MKNNNSQEKALPSQVDLIVEARYIIPIEPALAVLENHSLVVHQDKIIALTPTATVQERYLANHVLQKKTHIIMPGFVNTHTHAAMNLFRGLADDLALMDWLNHHIWPAENRFVTPQFVEAGTKLAIAEMLRGGTTCFNDMYFFPDTVGQVASEVGIRASVGLIVIDFPTPWGKNHTEYFEKAKMVYNQFKENPLVSTTFCPHAPYSVNDDALTKVVTLAQEWQIPIQIHTHETQDEIEHSLKIYGKRPLNRLMELGFNSVHTQYVHMAHLDETDFDLLKQARAFVIHCAESNLKLASGFCPLQALMVNQIPCALGTDGAASNNDLDMLQEMRTAALLAKAISKNPRAISAFQALELATLGGANAMGLGNHIGSLRPGKSADFIAIDMSGPETTPLYHAVSQIVYAASRSQVTDVWVAGKQLLKNKKLTTLNLPLVLKRAKGWQTKIRLSNH